MDDDLPESVKKCLDILEENVEILANLELDLEDEKEDQGFYHQLLNGFLQVYENSKKKENQLPPEVWATRLIEDNISF